MEMSKPNLKEQYAYLNKLIFENSLPELIPIRWNHSKTSMGKTHISMSSSGEMTFKISISRFFLCTEHQYIETLIHEMIHVLMASKGEFKVDSRVHGPRFKEHMSRINRDFPQYRITVKEERQIPVDEKRIALQNGYLASFDNKIYFNLYSKDLDRKMQHTIVNRLPALYGISKGDIYFFQGRYSQLSTAPVRRNVKTLIGKIQFLRDNNEMMKIMSHVEENHSAHYSISKKEFIKSFFLAPITL